MKFATKPIRHYPLHLRDVATLLWKIKKSDFSRYSADMDENANKLHLKCCLLTNTAMTSAVTNLWCHKLITIVNKKQTVTWKIVFAFGMEKDFIF